MRFGPSREYSVIQLAVICEISVSAVLRELSVMVFGFDVNMSQTVPIPLWQTYLLCESHLNAPKAKELVRIFRIDE